jgi:hypothetical protein
MAVWRISANALASLPPVIQTFDCAWSVDVMAAMAATHAVFSAPAVAQRSGSRSSAVSCSLRFSAAVRGQALQAQQRSAVRAQRAAILTRAAAAADEEEQQYDQVRPDSAPVVRQWWWTGGRLPVVLRSPLYIFCVPAPAAHLRQHPHDFYLLMQEDNFQERVVQIRRVTKVVKGGKQLSFRAVVRGPMGVFGSITTAGQGRGSLLQQSSTQPGRHLHRTLSHLKQEHQRDSPKRLRAGRQPAAVACVPLHCPILTPFLRSLPRFPCGRWWWVMRQAPWAWAARRLAR